MPSTTSLISPSRPMGRRLAMPSYDAGSCTGVLITPRETALTRIPRDAYSIASDRVTAASPPLVRAGSAAGLLAVGLVDEAGADVDDVAASLGQHLADRSLSDV